MICYLQYSKKWAKIARNIILNIISPNYLAFSGSHTTITQPHPAHSNPRNPLSRHCLLRGVHAVAPLKQQQVVHSIEPDLVAHALRPNAGPGGYDGDTKWTNKFNETNILPKIQNLYPQQKAARTLPRCGSLQTLAETGTHQAMLCDGNWTQRPESDAYGWFPWLLDVFHLQLQKQLGTS